MEQRHADFGGDQREVAHGRLGDEALDREVAAVHFDDRAGARREGASVIVGVRAIGGADLDEGGAARRHDVGDAEVPTDLDEFSAAHDRLASRGEGLQGEHEGGGAVVHDERVLGAGEFGEQRGAVYMAAAARAERDVVLQCRCGARHLGHGLERGRGERRATQIGVQHHAGRVDRCAQ